MDGRRQNQVFTGDRFDIAQMVSKCVTMALEACRTEYLGIDATGTESERIGDVLVSEAFLVAELHARKGLSQWAACK
jgi:hypothetical protein